MPKIIDILLEEHQNIKKLLLVLEHELEVFDRSERPDYEILQTIIQYFQGYPESCHHPKEEMIFGKLKARDPTAAKRCGDVEADHGVEAKRLRSFARVVDYILADQEFLRETFHLAVHDFIEHQRHHLEKEERLLFPASVKALRPEDWAEIDARFRSICKLSSSFGRCLASRVSRHSGNNPAKTATRDRQIYLRDPARTVHTSRTLRNGAEVPGP